MTYAIGADSSHVWLLGFRWQRGVIFNERPQAGESGSIDHLVGPGYIGVYAKRVFIFFVLHLKVYPQLTWFKTKGRSP
jgi:hypothetical protein